MGLRDVILKHAQAMVKKLDTNGPERRYQRQDWDRDLGIGSSLPNWSNVALSMSSEKRVLAPLMNKMALEVSALKFRHVKIDEDEQFTEVVDSGLNNIFKVEANIDQSSQSFLMDVCLSMFDEGYIALVPIEYETDIVKSAGYDVSEYRVGRVIEFYPRDVRIEVYNDFIGEKVEVVLPKKRVPIVENPFFMIMNEPNSDLQRLIRKLQLLDIIDEQSGSGKLDILIQVPFVINNEKQKERVEERRKSIEMQMAGSRYGIGYIDQAEKVVQLNRAADNNLLRQVETLTAKLYHQFGFTEAVFNGTADEAQNLNFINSAIAPIADAVASEVKRKSLTKTARSRGHSFMYLINPFKLVPVKELANIADKMTRNEILSPNDIRRFMGIRPSKDPKADELRNRNINAGNIEGEETQEEVEDNDEN